MKLNGTPQSAKKQINQDTHTHTCVWRLIKRTSFASCQLEQRPVDISLSYSDHVT